MRRVDRRGKTNAPLLDARRPDGGLEQPFPIPLVPRGVLANWRVTMLSLQSFGRDENKVAKNGVFSGHTLCLGSPVYTVMTIIGRVRSTTLSR